MMPTKRACLFLFLGVVLFAQAPTALSRIWLYYKLAGDSATTPPRQQWVYMDYPLRVEMVDGSARLRVAPEFTCRPEQDYYVGTQQASYPLKAGVNPNTPVSVYVNGLLLSPDKFTVAPDRTKLTIAAQFPSPEIIIRYCTM